MFDASEWSAIRLSLVFGVSSATLGLPLAVALGYWLSRSRSFLKWPCDAMVQLPLVLPPTVTGYLLLCLLGPRGPIGGVLLQWFDWKVVFTPTAAVLAALVVSFPLSVRAMRLAFESVDPNLEAAARSLGRGPLAVFVTITLPIAQHGLVVAWLLAFARSLGEFGATLMVAGNIAGVTQTIPLAIYSGSSQPGMGQSWRLVFVSIVLSCAAVIVGGLLDRKVSRHAT